MTGLGSLYKQPRSKYWWYQFRVHGHLIRGSTHETSERKAEAVLRTKIEQIGAGGFVNPGEGQVTFAELAQGYVDDYEIKGNRTPKRNVTRNVRVLTAHFGRLRALEIRQAHIQAFIRSRRADGLANSSVNRELVALLRMFSIAIEHEVLSRGPKVKLLTEDNVRRNFLTPADFESIVIHAPDYLRDPLRWLYLCGGRKNEMVSLQWRDVGDSEVTIRAENTKTKRSRTIPLVGELNEIIERARSNRRLDCAYVFHRYGRPLGDFRKAWDRARRASGYAGTWIHDFRRSAARNLVRTPGVSMHTAMAVGGWRTPSIFQRYDIQVIEDMKDALERTQERIADVKDAAKVRVIK
jgi:integrase